MAHRKARQMRMLGRRTTLRVEGLEHRITPTTGLRVALISDSVDQFNAITQSATAGTVVRVYDGEQTDTSGLLELLEQTSSANGGERIARLALFTHGSAGRVNVGGGDVWGAVGWNTNSAEWERIRRLLSEDATLELYSCYSGMGRTGQFLVSELARLTGADVFASTDAVGSGSTADFDWEIGPSPLRIRNELFDLRKLERINGFRLEDAYEPNDTAAEVDGATAGAANSPNLGTLSGVFQDSGFALQDTADWFKFVTTETGTSHDFAIVTFSNAQGDIDLQLISNDGVSILTTDAAAFNNFAEVSLAGRAPGTYYIKVYDNASATNPNYTLTIHPPGTEDDDPYEDNDTRAEVDAESAGAPNSPNLGTVTSDLQINDLKLEDAADWYRVETTATGTSHDFARITFEVPGNNVRNSDLDLELRASDGVSVLRSSFAAFDLFAEVSFATFAAGTYYIRVIDNGGGGNSNYSLTIDPPGDESDDLQESNDSKVQVDAAPPGGVNSPNLGVVTSEITNSGLKLEDNVDWFRFETTATGTSHDFARISFAVPGSNPRDGDLDIELLASDGVTVLRSSYAAFDLFAEVSLAALPAATYYLRVLDNGGNGNSQYSLILDPPTDEADDVFDDNDSPAQVDLAPPGAADSANFGTVTSELLLNDLKLEDSADWYRFTTTATGTSHDFARIAFAVPGSNPRDGDLDLELYGSDGTSLLRSTYAAFDLFAEVSLAALPAGTYYLRVLDNGGNGNSDYSLILDPPTDESDDAYEENDTRTAVDARIAGEPQSPNLGVLTTQKIIPALKLEDTDDWYRFELTSTATASQFARAAFTTNAATRDLDIDLQVVRSDGTVFASDFNAFGTTAEVSLNTLVAGVYYVRVFDNGGNAHGDYTLTINPTPGGPELSLLVAPGTFAENAGNAVAMGTVTRTGSTASDLTVNLFSSRPGEATVQSTVVIPATQTSATFPVNAIDDLVIDGSQSVSLTANASGLASGFTTITVTDNDAPPGVTIVPSAGSTVVTEGGPGDNYSIILTTQPIADVVIDITSGSQVTTSPTSLTFTSGNWNVAQNVTVDAVDDGLSEGTHGTVITHSSTSADPRFNGLAVPTLPVTVIDNDQPGVLIVESGGTTFVSEAGANDSYTIVLTSRPTAAVTVLLATSTQLNVNPPLLTFTPANWFIPQPVTVSAVDDSTGEGNHGATITHTVSSADGNYANLAASNVDVAITDNDVVPGILIAQSGGTTEVIEGGADDTYAVMLSTQPTASVTVTLGFGSQLDVNPTTLVFTTGNWNTPQVVFVEAVNDTTVEGDHEATITHTVSSGDLNYDGIAASGLVVGISDNDITLLAAIDVVGVSEDSGPTPLAVLTNDTGAGILLNGVTQGSFGTVVITGGGTGLTYEPNPNFHGTDVFTYTIVDDNGSTATAGVLVNVASSNDAPVLNLPGPQTIRVNTATTINGIFVNDSDALQGDGLLEISLEVQHGTLTLSTLAGVFFAEGDGVADRTMRFTGSLPSVTAALAALVYKPRTDSIEADSLSVEVSDLGNTGTGGVLTASGSIALNPLENQIVLQPNPTTTKLQDLVIYGKTSNDDILIKGGGSTITVSLNGSDAVPTFLTFKKVTGRILVFGLAGNDKLNMTKVGKVGILSGGAGNDTLVGGSKNDRLSGGSDEDSFDGGKGIDRVVEVADVNFTLTPTSLTGGLGNDVLVNIEEAELTGGDGNNTFDASLFLGKTFLFGGNGNDSLTSGQGGGIIFAGDGVDVLTGGNGRDVLIGGLGADALDGKAGEDLLIGGTTIHDGNSVALEAIAAEWHHKTRKYPDRIARILGTKPKGLNKTFLLNSTTVSHDGAANTLTGGTDTLDWFFAKNGVDALPDPAETAEIVTPM